MATARFLDALVGEHSPDEPVETFLLRYVRLAVADPHHYRAAFTRDLDARRRPPCRCVGCATTPVRCSPHAWPDDTKRATMHRVIRTWSTVHGMLDLAGLGLVVTDGPDALVRYVVRSGLRSADA